MSLPFDVSRCNAALDEDGEIQTLCQTCRRHTERYPAGERSPWFVFPPFDNGCDAYLLAGVDK